jgi:acyl transferase domain-containing protein
MSEAMPFDERTGLEVAVIGLAGRFPGARDVHQFWNNLREGKECLTELSDEDMAAAGAPKDAMRSPRWVRRVRSIEGADRFDAAFFGVSPREADLIDPQQRIFLECSWEALEDAGYDADRLRVPVGVYGGSRFNSYLLNVYSNQGLVRRTGDLQVQISNDKDYLATRVSYRLDLGGPSMTVQTACSTTLVAVHLACQALNSGECGMAIAGGVGVRIPEYGYGYTEGDVASPDGHVRPFDAKARGTVFGSGMGAVVLKRLDDALRDGDNVRAVIRGSAVTNDGAAKVGFTAPGVDGQYRVIRAAHVAAEVEADSIGYVEAHGTGTQMGDPIEVEALTRAFRDTTERRGFCALASVKGNIGHMGAAAGAASLIKAVLCLEKGELPASILFDQPNPEIDFESSPFFVNTELSEWRRNGAPRRAGVSAFGIGGTNAHIVLEEAPPVEAEPPARPWQLVLLSARSPSALEAQRRNLAARLGEDEAPELADAAYTLQVGRRVQPHRMAAVCADREEAVAALSGEAVARTLVGHRTGRRASVAFLFSGQGSQYPGMTRGLYEREPVYRDALDRCLEILSPLVGSDLRSLLFPEPGDEERAAAELGRTANTQPALFAVEYSLARLWESWGVRPEAMAGHSIGEYVAACLAGVFSLEDALALVAARGRLMEELPAGDMLAVPLSEAEVEEHLGGQLSVAAVNAVGRSVVSGPSEAVAALREHLEAQGLACRPLHTSHAFHSAMMEPILAPFVERFEAVALHAPAIPFVSNVTGTWITAEEATDPGYWARHLRGTVRFAAGVGELLAHEDRVLLEVGPGNALTTLARRHPVRKPEQDVVATTRHPKETEDDQAFVLKSLGQLWIAGVPVDWDGFYGDERRRRVPLPTYPFERQRYWIEPWAEGGSFGVRPDVGEKREDVSEWFYVPSWKPSMFPAPAPDLDAEPRSWLLLTGDDPLSGALPAALRARGQRVTTVTAGDGFARAGDGAYRVAPGGRDDYGALVKALVADEALPDVLVHLWNVGPAEAAGVDDLPAAEQRAFWSHLFLAQALGRQGVDRPVRWLTVSSHLQRVRGESALCPERATLLGPVKVIPLEYPNLACRSLDVLLSDEEDGGPRGPGDAPAFLVDVLVSEATGECEDRVVAVRSGERWVLGYEAVALGTPDEASLALREGGVYLITGGLGGIGLSLAEYLAREHRARLVLLGLSALPERSAWDEWIETHGASDRTSAKIRQVRRLEELGGEVLALSADVADREQMRAVLRQTVERFGALHGVVHAAGLAGGGMIQLKAQEVAARVLAPKVRGTLVLAAALEEAGVEPDFVFLCSSTISCVGGLGQVDYCAANSFLDAYAHRERLRYDAGATRVRTVAVNWGAWEEVGMAVAAGLVAGSPEQGNAPVAAGPVHPLIDRCLREASDQTLYATDFSPERHWVLGEHRILGTPALPGTAHIEIARAAFTHHASSFEQFEPGSPVEIRDLFFLTPLMLPVGESREAHVFLEREGGRFKFRLATRAGGDGGGEGTWTPHSRGIVGPAEPGEAPHVDLDAIRERCSVRTLEIEGPVMNTEGQGVVFWGDHWQSLRTIWVGAGEGLARLELPEQFEEEVREMGLHPALVDVATGIIGFIEEDNYLPLSYGRVIVRKPLPRRIYSHLRKHSGEAGRETLAVDVTLLDDAGEVLVEIEHFAMKKIGAAAAGFHRQAAPALPARAEAATAEGSEPRPEEPRPEGPKAPSQIQASSGILPAEGVEAFRRVLSRRVRAPQVVTTAKDLFFLIEQTEQMTRDRLMSDSGSASASQPEHDRPSLPTPYVAPRTDVERRLAEIWQSALGIRKVGIHDNFFDLGGDSVMGIQLVARVNESGLELSPDQLFEHQTVAELAAIVSGGEQARPPAEVWHEWLREQAAGPWRESLDPWLSEERFVTAQLAASGAGEGGERWITTVALGADAGRQLADEVLPALRATLEEVVLAALARSVSRRQGADRVLVRLTGDGREVAPRELGLADQDAPLRFEFPALIDLAELADDSPAALVRTVKEQRRSVPGGGASWLGLLQSEADPFAAERLRAMPAPQIALTVGALAAAASELPAAVEVRAVQVDGRLELSWSVDPSVLDPVDSEALAAETLDLLARIAGETDTMAVSPTDFPDADLDEDALESVLAKLAD